MTINRPKIARLPNLIPIFDVLPLNDGTMTLSKKEQQVPERFTLSETDIIPFHAGETLVWSVELN